MSRQFLKIILMLAALCLSMGLSLQAQPATSDKCIPNYSTNVSPNCPSLTSRGGIRPTSFCVKMGDPLPDPTYTPGSASTGDVLTTITENCSGNSTTSDNPVSYSFFWYYYPAKPTPSVPGVYKTTAYEDCVSSDTNDCPSPGVISMGDVTWNVISTQVNKTTISIDFSTYIKGMEGILEAIPVGWSFNPKDPKAEFEKTISTSATCCDDGSVGQKIEREGKLSLGISGQGSTPNYPLPITLGIVQVQLSMQGSISLDVSCKSESTTCPSEPPGHYCIVPSLTLTATGSISVSAFSSSLLSASGTVSGGGALSGSWCYNNSDDSRDPDDEKPVKVCYSDIDLGGKVTILSGISYGVSVTLVKGSCP